MLGIGGFGKNDISLLYMPAEDYLYIGLAVFLSQFRKNRFAYEAGIAMTDGIP